MPTMAEAGYSANEIAAWSGHATLTEIRRYTDAADQERMARNAMARENTGRTELSNSMKFDTFRPKPSEKRKRKMNPLTQTGSVG